LLLNRYGDSEAAAQYRWKVALAKAKKRLPGAWQWAQPIPIRNPKAFWLPRAGFGSAIRQMGRQRDGKAAFEYVLSQFPYSYGGQQSFWV